MNKVKTNGIIIGIQGPVVDVRFENETPMVHEALIVNPPKGKELILEVAFLIGNNEVKTLSNEQQQIVQRITVVETESKQYRSDISEIKEDIKAIRKGLGIK